MSFSQVPATIRTPGVYVEVGSSGGGAQLGGQPYRLGLIGQMLASGTATPLEPLRVTRAEDAAVLYGAGSMLHQAAVAAMDNAREIELYAVPMEDPALGTAAEGTVTVTAAVDSRAGTIPLYVDGYRLPVAVSAGATATEIATRLADAVNARSDFSVTAAAAAAVVTLTAKHKGIIGNAIQVKAALLQDEVLPTGVSLAILQPTGGAGEADIDGALAALGDDHYNVLSIPYTDSAALTSISEEMDARASATRQLGALAITASTGTFGELSTLGLSRNSERLMIVGASGSPSAPWQWAAAVAAIVTRDAAQDPARPYTGVGLVGLRSSAASVGLTDIERDTLLRSGIATVRVLAGALQLERLITTYRLNDLGAEDITLLDITGVLTLELFRYEIRQLILTKYSRFKIADDGQGYSPGSDVITPSDIKAEIVALYSSWVERGLAERADNFAASLIVERSESDPSRINVGMRPDITNALRVVGARILLEL